MSIAVVEEGAVTEVAVEVIVEEAEVASRIANNEAGVEVSITTEAQTVLRTVIVAMLIAFRIDTTITGQAQVHHASTPYLRSPACRKYLLRLSNSMAHLSRMRISSPINSMASHFSMAIRLHNHHRCKCRLGTTINSRNLLKVQLVHFQPARMSILHSSRDSNSGHIRLHNKI